MLTIGLAGRLPSEIGLLTSLKTLRLHDNLTGRYLPQNNVRTICRSRTESNHDLVACYMFACHGAGEIPTSLGCLPSLVTLDLTGPPSHTRQKGLTGSTWADLSIIVISSFGFDFFVHSASSIPNEFPRGDPQATSRPSWAI